MKLRHVVRKIIANSQARLVCQQSSRPAELNADSADDADFADQFKFLFPDLRLSAQSAASAFAFCFWILVVAAEHANHDSLHPTPIRLDNPGLHRAVGGLEADARAFLVEALQGCFTGVKEGNDLLAVFGIGSALDDDVVAVAEVIFDHRIPADLQDIDAIARGEELLEVD